MRFIHGRFVAVLISALLLSACAGSGGTRPPKHVIDMEQQVKLPNQLGKLSVSRQHIYEDQSAGVLYRYSGDLSYFVDVFVYPLNEHQEKFLIKSEEEALLTDEYGRFRAELKYAVEQGWYESAEPVSESINDAKHVITVNGETIEIPFKVILSRFNLMKDGESLASFMGLSEFKGYFVKIRLTHPEYPGLDAEMTDFAEQLFSSLYKSDQVLSGITVENKKADGKIDVMCLPGESIMECLSRAIRQAVDVDKKPGEPEKTSAE